MAERLYNAGAVMLVASDALAVSCRRVAQGARSAVALRDAQAGLAVERQRAVGIDARLQAARAKRAASRAALIATA